MEKEGILSFETREAGSERRELVAGSNEQKRLFRAYGRLEAERKRLLPKEGVILEVVKI